MGVRAVGATLPIEGGSSRPLTVYCLAFELLRTLSQTFAFFSPRPRKGVITNSYENGGTLFDTSNTILGLNMFDGGPVYHPDMRGSGESAWTRTHTNRWKARRYIRNVKTYDNGDSLWRHRSREYSDGIWIGVFEVHALSATSFVYTLFRWVVYGSHHLDSGVSASGTYYDSTYWQDVNQVYVEVTDIAEAEAYIVRHRNWEQDLSNGYSYSANNFDGAVREFVYDPNDLYNEIFERYTGGYTGGIFGHGDISSRIVLGPGATQRASMQAAPVNPFALHLSSGSACLNLKVVNQVEFEGTPASCSIFQSGVGNATLGTSRPRIIDL